VVETIDKELLDPEAIVGRQLIDFSLSKCRQSVACVEAQHLYQHQHGTNRIAGVIAIVGGGRGSCGLLAPRELRLVFRQGRRSQCPAESSAVDAASTAAALGLALGGLGSLGGGGGNTLSLRLFLFGTRRLFGRCFTLSFCPETFLPLSFSSTRPIWSLRSDTSHVNHFHSLIYCSQAYSPALGLPDTAAVDAAVEDPAMAFMRFPLALV
jgi:hypothetical protein